MKRIFLLLILLILHGFAFRLATGQEASNLHQTATFDAVIEYFFQCLDNEMGICFDNPDQYCIRAQYCSTLSGNRIFSLILEYYDEDRKTRNSVAAYISVDLQPFDVDTYLSTNNGTMNIRGRSIYIGDLKQESYPRSLWEKEKTMLQAMAGWYDPRKTMPLWSWTEKYEFFKENGGYPGDALLLIYDYHYPGITRPIAIMDIPKNGEMQYEEALDQAWQLFQEHASYEGNQDDLSISSVCLRRNEETIKSAQAKNPDIPDDGLQWFFRFYEPVCLDNGEMVYIMVFDTISPLSRQTGS